MEDSDNLEVVVVYQDDQPASGTDKSAHNDQSRLQANPQTQPQPKQTHQQPSQPSPGRQGGPPFEKEDKQGEQSESRSAVNIPIDSSNSLGGQEDNAHHNIKNSSHSIDHTEREPQRRSNMSNLFMVAEEEPQSSEVMGGRPENEPSKGKSQTSQVKVQISQSKSASSVPQELTGTTVKKASNANRAIGIVLLFLLTFLLWIYGFGSEYRLVTSSTFPVNTGTQSIFSSLLTITAMFAVIGFGMLFIYFKKMTESALFSSLFIVSFTMLFSPVLQKFWYNVFVGDFTGATTTLYAYDYFLSKSMEGQLIYLDLYNIKFGLICAISQLVVLLAIYGRMSMIQLATFSSLFNIGWSLNHYALLNVQSKAPDLRFFDDCQISSVYLFGAVFGVFVFIFMKRPPKEEQFQHSDFSAVFAYVGSFFLFFTFCGTVILFPMRNINPTWAHNYIALDIVLSTFFALCANVLTTLACSVLLVDQFQIRWSVFGLINGAVIFGSVANTAINIGAAIACGMGAGLLTVVYFYKIYPWMNRKIVADSYGIFLILATSLIATVFIAPIVLAIESNARVILPSLQSINNPDGDVVPGLNIAGYALTYPAITILVASGFGFLVSLLLKCFDQFDAEKVMSDRLFFNTQHGLRIQKESKRRKYKVQKQQKSGDQQQKINSSQRLKLQADNQKRVNESNKGMVREQPQEQNPNIESKKGVQFAEPEQENPNDESIQSVPPRPA